MTARRVGVTGSENFGTWASGLTVNGFAALRAAGFEPVGQVMGAVVHDFAWQRVNLEEYVPPQPNGTSVGTPMRSRWLAQYVDAVTRGHRTAMTRMAADCATIGGDGVVDVTVTTGPYEGNEYIRQFCVTGTAVRARGPVRPPRPFLSHLSAQDFVRLIAGGWVAVDFVFGVSLCRTPYDFHMWKAERRWASNRELVQWSRLLSVARSDAKTRLRSDVRRVGGEGAVLAAAQSRLFREKDGYAAVETTFTGTAITSFRTVSTQPLPIMRL